MIIYRPTTRIGDVFIGDVIRLDDDGYMLEGCGHRTDEAMRWSQAEEIALEAVGWSD